jgi:cellulose synthase/poly-beta-1,6-N-acetylglucosamine synthase-like glycosyltransferase
MSIIWFLLTALALIICVPVVVLFIEVVAAVVLKERGRSETNSSLPRPRIAVLIPAHDEGAGVVPTIKDVLAQMHPGDRVLVVADNCCDDTADVARSAGAEVVERRDPERIGKGYALDFGVRCLEEDPPDILVVVDADCHLSEGALYYVAMACAATGKPAQALYRMEKPEGSDMTREQAIAQFAWIVRTRVRPEGLSNLGFPCQLMGTGMAFPWRVIQSASIATGHLVEDLKLGLDLAAIRLAPQFCSQACVDSTFPTSEAGRRTQRQRWEIGSLRILATDAPSFVWRALLDQNVPLLVLALDALVPPLAITAMIMLTLALIAALAAAIGIGIAPLAVASMALVLFVASLILAWRGYGREVLRPGDVARLPAYLLQKLFIYGSNRRDRWVRTDRG